MLSDTEQYGHQSHARPQERHQLGGFIGSSLPMRIAYDELERIAAVDDTVLVLGESGTGKELAARAVHDLSVRASDPFVIVDCAATSIANFERALFGAYARDDEMGQSREGLVTLAAGGSLFLNEVSELDYASQSLLLRFIDSGVFRCVGATEESAVDVRIIASSRRDLSEEVKAGRLREDLYYRLHVLQIRLPPLREILDDIPHITSAVLDRLAAETGRPFDGLTYDAEARLLSYDWPGNVRQLQSVLRWVTAMTVGSEISADVVMKAIAQFDGRSEVASPAETDFVDSGARTSGVKPLWLVEKEVIQHAIDVSGGNINRAAALLEVAPSTIYRKVQGWKHG
jgi:two-component system repressor protein LuxO